MRARGFTLIELLVVIAIIGLLSTVVIASVGSARKKARDATRIANLTAIRVALELYYDDHGYYPQSACGWDCAGYTTSYNTVDWTNLEAELLPYLANLPIDPINSNCIAYSTAKCYSYGYGNVGKDTFRHNYDLFAQLETDHPERCAYRQYKYYFDNRNWCGTHSGYLFEASLQ